MTCQNCGKNLATTHVKKTMNGKTTELHLCAACAAKQGLNTVWDGLGLDLGNFWGSLFAEPAVREKTDTVRCECCGSTFGDIAKNGTAGCPACYTTFYDQLLPSIRRIHGKTRHTGKTPVAAGEEAKKERELDVLKKQLAESIASQEYEKCAELRDSIRALEEGRHDGE